MRRFLAAATSCLLIASAASAQDAPDPAPQDRAAAVDWLEALGVPDVEGRPLVRVVSTLGGDEGRSWATLGFLLEETEERVTVVGLGMVTEHVYRANAEVRIVEEPLATFVDSLVEGLGEAERHPFGIRRPFEGHLDLPPLGEIVFLASVCRSRGLHDRAAALLAAADAIPSGREDRPADASLVEKLRADLDTPVFWRTLLLFQDASRSRPQILEAFRRYLDRFPGGEHRERATSAVELLERMIRQDEARAASLKPWDEMSEEERIADLIHQLRDQPGGQFMQPGAPGFFRDADENGGVEPPIARLEKIGHAAVPQLIEALDDPEFTRCIGFHRDFYFSHYVQRVGDAALSALTTIAGTSFYDRRSTSGAMWKDGESGAVRAAVEAWWRDYREQGEVPVRVLQVREGSRNCRSALAWLVKNAPEHAAAAAREGLRNAREDRFVSDIVQELRALKTDESTQLLVEAMDDPRAGTAQTWAAIELLRRGVVSARRAILREWERMEEPRDGSPFRHDGSIIAGAFLEFADDEAIRDLPDRYPTLSESRRGALVDALEGKWIFERTDAGRHWVFESILLAALDDHVHTGTKHSAAGQREIRRSDEAAQALLRRYDDTGIDRAPPVNFVDREPWLLAVRNAVRAKHGLPAVAAPPPLPEGPLAVGDASPGSRAEDVPEALRRTLEEQKGAPIDRENMGRLIDAVAAAVAERGGSVRVVVTRRPGRLARVDLTYVPSADRGSSWDLRHFAQVGPHTVEGFGSFGTTAREFPDGFRRDVLDTVDRCAGHDEVEAASLYLEFTVSRR